jgi:hypothetical protein
MGLKLSDDVWIDLVPDDRFNKNPIYPFISICKAPEMGKKAPNG